MEQRALCLRLVSPKAHDFKRMESQTRTGCANWPFMLESDNETVSKCNGSDVDEKDLGAFSSIQSLLASPQEKVTQESVYVHPLLGRTSSSLSEKSLELCTENLGCETGTDITENSYLASSSEEESESKPPRRKQRSNQSIVYRGSKCGTFPPPLTSIAGGASIHVRSYRKEGRLVLKASSLPSTGTYFQAERGGGRLRLRFLNQNSLSSDVEAATKEEEKEKENEVEDEDGYENGEREEENCGTVYSERNTKMMEDVNGNEGNVGGEMGMDKIQRLSRCSEGGGRGSKEMLRWKPFLVASS